ncbi:MAG: 30S ribosomal protein S6 [Acutalibacteraceae bacterium]
MTNYETMIVISVADGEEKTQAVVEKFKALIEANGTIANVDDWGKRKLAYAINYESDGYYVVITFASEPDFPAELDRVANITEGVLRLQTVRKA